METDIVHTDAGDVVAEREEEYGPWIVVSPWGGFRFWGSRDDVRSEMKLHIASNTSKEMAG